MDQSKFLAPRNMRMTKEFESLYRVQLQVLGILVDGVAEILYYCDQDLAHDSGQVVTAISRTLDLVKGLLDAWHIPMPAHLCILTDNATKEGKTRQYSSTLQC